jgi:hypothetical protein
MNDDESLMTIQFKENKNFNIIQYPNEEFNDCLISLKATIIQP